MNRDKQIENMARAIHINCHKGLTSTEATMIAKWCYQEIDRKASEVAREIFEEIDKCTIRKVVRNGEVLYDFSERFDELKKKYTGE